MRLDGRNPTSLKQIKRFESKHLTGIVNQENGCD